MIVFCIIIYTIINCEVSYKYEIEEGVDYKVGIEHVGAWIREAILILKWFLFYIFLNILYLIFSIFNDTQKHKK